MNDPDAILAQLTAVSGEFLINTTTQGRQESPLTTPLAGGGFAVLWGDHTSLADNDTPLRARVYDGAGVPLGEDFKVSLDPPHGYELSPSIVARPDGGFAVVWALSGGFSIVFRLFDAEGTPESGQITAATVGLSSGTPKAVALSNGNFAVTWLEPVPNNVDIIQAGIFRPDGSAVARDIGVTSPGAGLPYQLDVRQFITALDDGSFMVTWLQGNYGQTVHARIVSASGHPGPAFELNTRPISVNERYETPSGTSLYFTLWADMASTALADGRILTVWEAWDGNDRAVLHGRVLSPDGVPVGDEIDLGCGAEPVVTAQPDGGFALAWYVAGGTPGVPGHFNLQAFDADGHAEGRQIRLETMPTLSTLADGRILVTEQGGDDGSLGGITGRVIDLRDEAIDFRGTALDDFALGTKFDDRLRGVDGDDRLSGQAGNDRIEGGAGADILGAGDGDDTVLGQDGADQILGGRGIDRLLGGAGDDQLWGEAGNDRIEGGEGKDILQAGDGDDTALGQDGADQILGGRGADRLSGGAGRDLLWGDAGNDVIDGGEDVDYVRGGAGADRLRGGAGADRFVYEAPTDSRVQPAGRDTILDFSRAEGDRIDLTNFAGVTFVFLGSTTPFSGRAGELAYSVAGREAVVYGDIDGDRRIDFSIALYGVDSLAERDFLL